jgi:glycosyltransferase involved in cell wall biosynthesis
MGEYREPGVRVLRVPVIRNRDGYLRGYLAYLAFDALAFLRLLGVRRPDVLIAEPPPTTGWMVRLVAALRRARYVYYAADIWSDAAASLAVPPVTVRVLRRVESAVARGAGRVLAVNELVGDRVRDLAPESRVAVVGNGVDVDVFRPEGPAARAAAYAIYAGTMSEWQQVDVFVRALALVADDLPDGRIVFLGQGTARGDLERVARELGVDDRVEFHAPVPALEAAAWIRGARVSLVSIGSDAGYDFAVPTKVMASLACGTPVLFSGPEASPVRALLERAAPRHPGEAVSSAVSAVAEALVRAWRAPVKPAERERLAAWAAEAVSLAAVAARAADEIDAVAT